MREIVFRGKNAVTGKWIHGNLLTEQHENAPVGAWILPDALYTEILVDPCTVGQYIGLRDKTGARIFEGDILRWEFEDGEPEIAEVTWRDDGHEGVGWYIRSIRPFPGLDILCSGDSEWEVIGNIYDNPELLEEKPHETN